MRHSVQSPLAVVDYKSLSASACSGAEPNWDGAFHSSVHPRLLGELWEDWKEKGVGGSTGESVSGGKKPHCKSPWLANELNDYQTLVCKVLQNLSSSANQLCALINQSNPSWMALVGGWGSQSEFLNFSSICFSCSYFCVWLSLTAHRCVCATAALSLWETENSQGHNYRTELSIYLSINPVGREGDKEEECAKKRAKNLKFVIKRIRPALRSLSHWGTVICFSGERRELVSLWGELDPTIRGQTSYYTVQDPLFSLPANRLSLCSFNALRYVNRKHSKGSADLWDAKGREENKVKGRQKRTQRKDEDFSQELCFLDQRLRAFARLQWTTVMACLLSFALLSPLFFAFSLPSSTHSLSKPPQGSCSKPNPASLQRDFCRETSHKDPRSHTHAWHHKACWGFIATHPPLLSQSCLRFFSFFCTLVLGSSPGPLPRLC